MWAESFHLGGYGESRWQRDLDREIVIHFIYVAPYIFFS